MKYVKRVLISIPILVSVILVSGIIWSVLSNHPAEPVVEPYIVSSDEVLVEDNGWISFRPSESAPAVGFIFYPGGNVDHLAYAPALHQIAAQGFLVVDVAMPLDLAVLAPDKALEVIDSYPEIKTWVIGGHSLGGAMAARFIYQYPEKVSGLVLWAAYPAESNSLAGSNTPVISIYGTLDGLASPEEIESSIPLLPENTLWVPIEGGNHAQFGNYGAQNRDNPAQISRQEQQSQIIAASVDFLQSFRP